MEESKNLQTLYKVFRTFIYVSLIVEFFEYAINPDVLDHWGLWHTRRNPRPS